MAVSMRNFCIMCTGTEFLFSQSRGLNRLFDIANITVEYLIRCPLPSIWLWGSTMEIHGKIKLCYCLSLWFKFINIHGLVKGLVEIYRDAVKIS